MLNFLGTKWKKKKENHQFLQLQLFQSFKAEQQIHRLCYFAIFSPECAKELCQQKHQGHLASREGADTDALGQSRNI